MAKAITIAELTRLGLLLALGIVRWCAIPGSPRLTAHGSKVLLLRLLLLRRRLVRLRSQGEQRGGLLEMWDSDDQGIQDHEQEHAAGRRSKREGCYLRVELR